MPVDLVTTEVIGRVAIIRLNDPDSRNALSDELVDQLVIQIRQADDNEQVHCAVLTGSGRDFCAGGNVKDMYHQSSELFRGTPAVMQDAYQRMIQRVPKLFHAIDMPMVAAVNGNALGAGCDIACMCDIRIATPATAFAESFLRVGLISGDGGAWYLPRVVGVSRALEMALTCDQIKGEHAVQWGLASRLVDEDALIDEALAVAGRIASFSRRGARLNKRLIRRSAELDLADSLEVAAAFQSIVQHTQDQREAVAALVEKRQPSFSGH